MREFQLHIYMLPVYIFWEDVRQTFFWQAKIQETGGGGERLPTPCYDANDNLIDILPNYKSRTIYLLTEKY